MKLYVAALIVGGLTGAATSSLLYALTWATAAREAHAWIYWGLGPAGALITVLYGRYGREAARGTKLVIAGESVPFVMAPLIWFTTVLTHLVGGSAGREGSAVQVGGAVAERVARWFRQSEDHRRVLLVGGIAAGFAAAIGAPLAGILFSLEVLPRERRRARLIPVAALAALASVAFAHVLRAPHLAYPSVRAAYAFPDAWIWTPVAGVVFGVVARLFIKLTHALEGAFARLPLPAPGRTAIGGLILSLLFTNEGLRRYAGLGLDVIQEGLLNPVAWWDPLLKLGLTALTLGAGFKGGEFIPLVFLGTTAGRVLQTYVGTAAPLAALGFGAVFGAAARAPLACAVMVAELFGPSLFPLALVAGGVAHLCAGRVGIYSTQQNRFKRKS